MRKSKLYILILICFISILIVGVLNVDLIVNSLDTKNYNELINSEPVLAEFSFKGGKSQLIESFPHYSIRLYKTNNLGQAKEKIVQIPDRAPFLLTIETWESQNHSDPLADFSRGEYDHSIKDLCTDLIRNRSNAYIRFNPEMEVPANLYPWQKFGSYIEAFQHFSKLIKKYAPQAKIVWGPAGYPGAMEWYPGDEYVDAASVTIKSSSESNLNVYPSDYSLEYDLFRRLHRLRFIDKPIFVLGSQQTSQDSIDKKLISSVNSRISLNKNVIYSEENFERPENRIQNSRNQKFEIGLYDPLGILIDNELITAEHLFVDFDWLVDGGFQKEFKSVIDREHDIIVTFEPFWKQSSNTDLQVLKNVTLGKYDNEIKHLYEIIMSTDHKVYLRYAHEMEIPIRRYTWQSQDPIDYVKSYRYFMTFMGSLPETVKRVWGPAGDRGSIEWYPGNDVVDYISIAIYGLPDKNITDFNKQESFETIFNRKYRRMRYIDKPFFITEFGVLGTEDYQMKWLSEAGEVISNNKSIYGICYFNMTDTPKVWGEIDTPDWSISRKTLNMFVKTLQVK